MPACSEANPARRVAVIALSEHSQATQREIGKNLEMSTNQVAKILSRSRRRGQRSLQIDEWLQGIREDISSGGV